MATMENQDIVVVTGASAGVGRAVTREFAKRGARIGLLARGKEGLNAVLEEVKELGGDGIVIQTDVADPEAVEKAASTVEDTFGPIDIWVNNAMVTVFSPFKEIKPDEFRRVTEVTYLGVVYGTMAALKRMLPRDHGTIVQVGSALSDRSIPLQSAYCGAKHGIRGFTDSLRTELIHDESNVHLTMVQLPAVNTPQFRWSKSRLPHKGQPVPPIFQPEVPAQAIVWAAYHRRREIYVGLPTVEAIWGNKFIPGFLDRYLAYEDYNAQQTEEPEDPDRPDNLWEPVEGDFGAHGVFDDRAKKQSGFVWASEHIGWWRFAAGIAGLAATAGIVFYAKEQ